MVSVRFGFFGGLGKHTLNPKPLKRLGLEVAKVGVEGEELVWAEDAVAALARIFVGGGRFPSVSVGKP